MGQKFKRFIYGILFATTSTLLAVPQNHLPQGVFQDGVGNYQQEAKEWFFPNTYDEILQLLDELESGEAERKYSLSQLDKINSYLITLSKEGLLSNEFAEEDALQEDVYDLVYGEDSVYQLRFLERGEGPAFPLVLTGTVEAQFLPCGKISHAWKKTKKFVKKHKKEIIIGAVVVVAVAAVTVAVVVASSSAATSAASAAAAGVAASGGSGSNKSQSSGRSSSAPSGSQSQTSNDIPIFKSAMDEQISSFKENLAKENFFPTNPSIQGLSLEETGRAIGPIFAHDSFNQFNNHLSNSPQFSQEVQSITSEYNFSIPPGIIDSPVGFARNEIDKRFASDYGPIFSDSAQEGNFNALSYQARGDAARYYGYYGQAVDDFTKAISMNPTDPTLYLQRSASYFDLGQYDDAIKDFNNFTSQLEKAPQNNIPQNIDLSASDLAFAFARGMTKGAYIAVKDLTSFVGDFVTHPIQTSTQVVQSISMLVDLTKNKEWGQIANCLVPEARQLINEWEALPWDERLERSGTIFTQYGGEIFLTGGAVKAGAMATKMSVKGAQNVARAAHGFKMARETLLLEAAAEIGSAAKVGEIVNASKSTLFLGRELGFTAKEMGQLKQAGKLEATLQNKFYHLSLSKQESINLFGKAEKFLRGHKGFRPEHEVRNLIHETGIPTFTRPKGIPENYRVKLSDNGAGMKYVHPKNEQTYVRVMPGKIHSDYPSQQRPYVINMKNGKTLDKSGNVVLGDALEAHIPVEEFVFIGD